ncbi:hypothetical protein FOL47_008418 [Perkinsus chesapeaki]|uniref:Uncharacterized protein n=1 Tax=Perkinsus chesapeaki TaxID=330153 RepID=A0A7J6LE51_PERCH|nr:hypothetical protein FOL47_008418 [Perkinsus chesapeaki]
MTGHWLMCLLALDAVLATNKKLGGWYKAEISKEICLDVFFHDREGTVQEEVICGQAGTVVSEEMMLKGKNPYTVAASDKPKLRHFLDDVKKICNIIFDPTKDGVFQYEEQQDIVLYKNGQSAVSAGMIEMYLHNSITTYMSCWLVVALKYVDISVNTLA